MRIGCLQFAPQVGDIDNNLNRADAVLSRANADDLMLDLLVLPELAFTGYNFKSLNDISPFLEPSGSGITSLWARTTALRYGCIVAVGYPEKVDLSPKWPTGPEYYNSAIVVNADGETVANYRKSFLYYTDETWALEGDTGFYDGFIPGLGNTSIGICMDLNPYKFEAPWHAFEFAMHILDAESNLVIVSMAWMTREDRGLFTRQPNDPDMETLTYWVTRMEPLIRSENQQEIIVVFCNRTGIEDEVTYAGTSAVIGIHNGEVNVYGLLGRGDKELLVVDTTKPPHAKLVYRPEPASAPPAELEMPKPSDLSGKQPGGQSRRDAGPDRFPSATSQSGSPKEDDVSASSRSRKQAGPRSDPSLPSDKRPLQTSPSTYAASSQSLRYSPPRTKDRGEKRRTGVSAVPDRLDLASCAIEGTNIPTPSAPSPTPMALRPRLTFSDSCPSPVWQPPSPETHRAAEAVACGGKESGQQADSYDPADFYRQPQRIPIAASPSILDEWEDAPKATQQVDGRTLLRPAPVTGHQNRSNSITNIKGTAHHVAWGDADRGRRPGSMDALDGSVYVAERASSADSSRNTILHHSRLRRRRSTTGDGLTQGRSPRGLRRQHDIQDTEDGQEFERFEAVVCPNCPVHGRRARSPRQRTGGRASAPAEARFRESMMVHAPSSPLPTRNGLAAAERVQTRRPVVLSRAVAMEGEMSCEGTAMDSSFNPVDPTTPRAMAFSRGASERGYGERVEGRSPGKGVAAASVWG